MVTAAPVIAKSAEIEFRASCYRKAENVNTSTLTSQLVSLELSLSTNLQNWKRVTHLRYLFRLALLCTLVLEARMHERLDGTCLRRTWLHIRAADRLKKMSSMLSAISLKLCSFDDDKITEVSNPSVHLRFKFESLCEISKRGVWMKAFSLYKDMNMFALIILI